MKNSKKIQTTGLILGVLCFFLAIGFIDSPPDHPHTGKMAAVTLLMAVWWITEALPLAATALLPLALFPFIEIMDGKQSPPPPRIVLGFMAATAFLSMWISNTATVVTVVPMALSIILKLEKQFGKEKTHNFSVSLMLGLAYSASLGGVATLIGTPQK